MFEDILSWLFPVREPSKHRVTRWYKEIRAKSEMDWCEAWMHISYPKENKGVRR